MRVDIFAPLHWSKKYDGVPVVYVLEWSAKKYVGSTTRLRGKISDMRQLLRTHGVAEGHVISVKKVKLTDLVEQERLAVQQHNSFTPHGHNRTSHGRGQGTGRNPASAVPPQLGGANGYDLFRSSAWAIPFRGRCMVYVIEWLEKAYVGTSEHLSQRIDVHRRALGKRGVTKGRVLYYEEVPITERAAAESATIAKWKTVQPFGHNKTPDGRGTWTDLARNTRWKKL